jgi:hypothetical protein
MRDVLKNRERALEYEFFHCVDEQLMARLREKIELEEQAKALADATGIVDDGVLAELVEINVTAETIFALSLFPLVWIAWADGSIEEEEFKAILAAAHSGGHERDTASHQLIENWLERRPDAKVQQAWKDYVHALCDVLTFEAVAALKQDIVARTRRIAEAAGGILGFHKVSRAQEAVLAEVTHAFTTG